MPKVEIKNFGPIASGKIELKPLTIFMGSNNSGKSYAALLIYSIMKSERQAAQKILDSIFKRIRGLPRSQRHDPLTRLTAAFDIQDERYEYFKNELYRNFSGPPSGLVQIGEKECTLKISSSILNDEITVSSNAVKHSKNRSYCMHVKTGRHIKNKHRLVSAENDSVTIHADVSTQDQMMEIMEELDQHYRSTVPNVHYLPASRYGVLQGHKMLSSQIIKYFHHMNLNEYHMPPMPGAVSDFLASLLEMPGGQRSSHRIAAQLEKDILHGSIEMTNSEPSVEINYRYRDQVIPLRRASSMVSEIAPLVLYLRYLVVRGSLLIMEEPESHLHPNYQIHLAKCIVDLVRNGIHVLITTHSPYLVEEIGNYLQAGGIPDSDRDKISENENGYIKPEEIAVYLFDVKQNTSKIKKVDVSTEDGISQDQFVDAFESISEHSRMIEGYYEHA